MSVFKFIGSRKPKYNNDKRNFLADAMREMETGGKTMSLDSVVSTVPNVIRVVMRPEVPPKHRHHHRHRQKHLGAITSILRLAEGLSKINNGRNRNKTSKLMSTENTLQETVQFLEQVNGQLENISSSQRNNQNKMITKPSGGYSVNVKDGAAIANSFPFPPELRSIVEHGKPFNPEVTRAAFARAKQIVWDSVGQDPTHNDVSHLNNSKLENAVALLEMAVREAEKMQQNKTETSVSKKVSETTPPIATTQKSQQDAQQLKILKDLLLKELRQANYTENKTGILISDIPFQKQRSNGQTNLMEKLPTAAYNFSLESKTSPTNKNPFGDTQALLENYTTFITNILKAAHLSVLRNLTGGKTTSRESNTKLNMSVQSQINQGEENTNTNQYKSLGGSPETNTPGQQQGNQQLSFANAAQEQNQNQQQHFPRPVLPKERLEARKAFGTAQKLVKAFLARQELYKAEGEFFKKIHEMLNKTSPNNPQIVGPVNDAQESMVAGHPTAASPIQSPLRQSPINTASTSSVDGAGNQKQTSEAQKKFEEAAHLEEKVAAQQDEMYDALMGHTIGTVKGDGGFDGELGTIREIPEQEGVNDSYNTEDYGDFKDSDEEAERKFYHDHRQSDFEAKAEDDSSFSLRDQISTLQRSKGLSNTELSGSGLQVGVSGDGNIKNNFQLKRFEKHPKRHGKAGSSLRKSIPKDRQ